MSCIPAITLWEPWASLVAAGAKPYEFRRWPAHPRFWGKRIAIHAGARPIRRAEVDDLLASLRLEGSWGTALHVGPATELLLRVQANPSRVPLSHVLCTATLGKPIPANEIEMDRLASNGFVGDSTRIDHQMFGWPLTDIEPLMPPVPARGAGLLELAGGRDRGMKPFICPICTREEWDERHVGIECFYDVHEVAPRAERVSILREVPADGSYLGTTRRYPAGTRDKHNAEATSENSFRVNTEQVACDAVRLLEQHLFSVACCKPCRSDFLRFFGEWASGKHVTRYEPDGRHCIPVRERGTRVRRGRRRRRRCPVLTGCPGRKAGVRPRDASPERFRSARDGCRSAPAARRLGEGACPSGRSRGSCGDADRGGGGARGPEEMNGDLSVPGDEQAKAVAESAKMAQQFADLAKGAGGYLADIFGDAPRDLIGWAVGDRLKFKRFENVLKLQIRANEKLRALGLNPEALEPPNRAFAVELMTAAGDEERDDIQDLFAALLAAASDPNRKDRVRTKHIEIVKALEPLDAHMLVDFKQVQVTTSWTRSSFLERVAASGIAPTQDEASVALDNLIDLKLINQGAAGHVNLTSAARVFLYAVYR